MVEAFPQVVGAAAPLLLNNVDTDTISPGSKPAGSAAPEFSEKGSSTLSADLFANLRYDLDGRPKPDFVLNKPEFARARILLGGRNFGCGSSREAAVWMLKDFGIGCVIAPSFGDIFYNNAFKNGILPIVLPLEVVESLAEEAAPGAPSALFTVDLAADVMITPSGARHALGVPEFRRQGMLQGLDEIDLTLARRPQIDAWLAAARAARPWTYDAKESGT